MEDNPAKAEPEDMPAAQVEPEDNPAVKGEPEQVRTDATRAGAGQSSSSEFRDDNQVHRSSGDMRYSPWAYDPDGGEAQRSSAEFGGDAADLPSQPCYEPDEADAIINDTYARLMEETAAAEANVARLIRENWARMLGAFDNGGREKTLANAASNLFAWIKKSVDTGVLNQETLDELPMKEIRRFRKPTTSVNTSGGGRREHVRRRQEEAASSTAASSGPASSQFHGVPGLTRPPPVPAPSPLHGVPWRRLSDHPLALQTLPKAKPSKSSQMSAAKKEKKKRYHKIKERARHLRRRREASTGQAEALEGGADGEEAEGEGEGDEEEVEEEEE